MPPTAVDVGGVDEVDAGIEGSVADVGGARLVEARAEVVAAKTHDADLETANATHLHSGRHSTVAAARGGPGERSEARDGFWAGGTPVDQTQRSKR